MKKYFDYLEQLRQSGETNMLGAAPYLQREFPELDCDRAQKILTTWMSGFGPSHVHEDGYSNATEAEAIFLFADFLSDLASHLCGETPDVKCHLCVHREADDKRVCQFGCSVGITEYLLINAALYHAQMEPYCKNYFEYLDHINNSGKYDLYSAEDALKTEFPYLASHPEYAKYAMASWMLKYWG